MPIAPKAPIPPSRPMNTGSVVIFARLEMNSGRTTLSADETTADAPDHDEQRRAPVPGEAEPERRPAPRRWPCRPAGSPPRRSRARRRRSADGRPASAKPMPTSVPWTSAVTSDPRTTARVTSARWLEQLRLPAVVERHEDHRARHHPLAVPQEEEQEEQREDDGDDDAEDRREQRSAERERRLRQLLAGREQRGADLLDRDRQPAADPPRDAVDRGSAGRPGAGSGAAPRSPASWPTSADACVPNIDAEHDGRHDDHQHRPRRSAAAPRRSCGRAAAARSRWFSGNSRKASSAGPQQRADERPEDRRTAPGRAPRAVTVANTRG